MAYQIIDADTGQIVEIEEYQYQIIDTDQNMDYADGENVLMIVEAKSEEIAIIKFLKQNGIHISYNMTHKKFNYPDDFHYLTDNIKVEKVEATNK
jgi:hypothetical protein